MNPETPSVLLAMATLVRYHRSQRGTDPTALVLRPYVYRLWYDARCTDGCTPVAFNVIPVRCRENLPEGCCIVAVH